MAVAYDEIASLVTRDRNRENARILAFQAYRKYGAALIGYLRANLRNTEDAEDLAQDVYVRIARHEDVARINSLKSFVFTIAKNLLRDKSRRCATRLAENCVHEDDVLLRSSEGDPLAYLEADDLERRVECALAILCPASREAYRLNRVYHYSYSAVADHMGVSVSMVEKHISAALSTLRASCILH